MEQLPLSFVFKVPYSRDNFVAHAGVQNLFDSLVNLAEQDSFQVAYVEGKLRSGKTHLSVAFCAKLRRLSKIVQLVSGEEFYNWAKLRLSKSGFSLNEVIIIDDAENFLKEILPGSSGVVVNFIEALRLKSGKLFLLSSCPVNEYRFDEHIASRLNVGSGYEILDPDDQDLKPLIKSIAKQYGYDLSDRSIGYIEKRVDRSIGGIEDFVLRLDSKLRAAPGSAKLSTITELFED